MGNATPISMALNKRATELLGDGEWHSYEEVSRELSKLIPPGVALRRNEHDRIGSTARTRKKNGLAEAPPRKTPNKPVEYLIASGARSKVREYLKNGAFETSAVGQTHRDPTRQIRLVGQLYWREDVVATGEYPAQSRGRYLDQALDLQRQLDREKARVAVLRDYLVLIGEVDAAKLLVPDE